jgi:hypothetical protein
VLVYQPQVNSWDGHRIDFRSALAIKPTGANDEAFGVIFANARTEVDKVARTVVFEDMKDHEDGLSDAAEPWCRLYGRAAGRVREDDPLDFARPPDRALALAGSRRRRSRCRTRRRR